MMCHYDVYRHQGLKGTTGAKRDSNEKKGFRFNCSHMSTFFPVFSILQPCLGCFLCNKTKFEYSLKIIPLIILFSKLVVILQQKVSLKKSYCIWPMEIVINLIPIHVILHVVMSLHSIVWFHLTCSCLFTSILS